MMITIPSGDMSTFVYTHWFILVAGNNKTVIIKMEKYHIFHYCIVFLSSVGSFVNYRSRLTSVIPYFF